MEDDESIGRDDCIFSWYLTDEGTFAEVAVGEKQAMEMKNPLFVVTPHPVAGEENGRVVNVEPQEVSVEDEAFEEFVGFRDSEKLKITRYQVKNPYFFEKKGKLEYKVWIGITYSDFPLYFAETSKKFSVSRQDVKESKIFYSDKPFGTYPHGTFTYNPGSDFYLLTWESDWYASQKETSCSCSCEWSSVYWAFPHMKYSNEWYNIFCGKCHDHFYSVGDNVTPNNYKGMVRVQRTE